MWVRVSTADRCRRKLKENTLERDLLADPFLLHRNDGVGMCLLRKAAEAWEKLLNLRYDMVFGRKKKSYVVSLSFERYDSAFSRYAVRQMMLILRSTQQSITAKS